MYRSKSLGQSYNRLARRVESLTLRVTRLLNQTNNPGLRSIKSDCDTLHDQLCGIIRELPPDGEVSREDRAMLAFNRREFAEIEREFQAFT